MITLKKFYLTFYRKRIFILGPSHHVRLRGCALSPAKKCETPFYDLKVDSKSIILWLFFINYCYIM